MNRARLRLRLRGIVAAPVWIAILAVLFAAVFVSSIARAALDALDDLECRPWLN